MGPARLLVALIGVAAVAAECPVNGTHDVLMAAAQVASSYNDTDTAVECITKAAQSTMPTLQMLANMLLRSNKTGPATAISGAIEAISGNGEAIMYHASNLLAAGKFEQARQRFKILVENNEENAQLHRLLSVSQWNTGEHEDALRTIERAAELDESFKSDADLLKETFKNNNGTDLKISIPSKMVEKAVQDHETLEAAKDTDEYVHTHDAKKPYGAGEDSDDDDDEPPAEPVKSKKKDKKKKKGMEKKAPEPEEEAAAAPAEKKKSKGKKKKKKKDEL